jgi:hypothetical protein
LQILKRSFTEGLDLKAHDCSFTILRYLIQSVYEELISNKGQSQRNSSLASELCKYVQRACQLHATLKQDSATQSRILELEWLFRISWNTAVYISAEGLGPEIAYICFTAVEDLFKLLVDPEPEFTQNLISR